MFSTSRKTDNFLMMTFGPLLIVLAATFIFPRATALNWLFTLLYAFQPAAAAVYVSRRLKQPIRTTLGLSLQPNWWFVVALLLPLGIALVTYCLSFLAPGIYGQRGIGLVDAGSMWLIRTRFMRRFVLVVPATLVALGGELGFRGLLFEDLSRWGFWRASGFIALAWGAWTALAYVVRPLAVGAKVDSFLAPGLTVIATAILFSPLFCYIRLKAKSVLAPALMLGVMWGSNLGVDLLGEMHAEVKSSSVTVFQATGWRGLGLSVLLAANLILFITTLLSERRVVSVKVEESERDAQPPA